VRASTDVYAAADEGTYAAADEGTYAAAAAAVAGTNTRAMHSSTSNGRTNNTNNNNNTNGYKAGGVIPTPPLPPDSDDDEDAAVQKNYLKYSYEQRTVVGDVVQIEFAQYEQSGSGLMQRSPSDEYVDAIERLGEPTPAAPPDFTELDHGFMMPDTNGMVVRLVSDPSRSTTRTVTGNSALATGHTLHPPARSHPLRSGQGSANPTKERGRPKQGATHNPVPIASDRANSLVAGRPRAHTAFVRTLNSVKRTNPLFGLRNSSEGPEPLSRQTSDV